jgi:putrescine---pyruvate transaminase
MEKSDEQSSLVAPVDVQEAAVRNLWHWSTQIAEFGDLGPTILEEGSGSTVRDSSGREYIDATSILGVTQIGHGRAEMAEAIAAQVMRLEYGSLANGFSNAPAALLAARLAALAPGDLEVCFFGANGTDANETAFKMARQYHRLRGDGGRFKIISREGSYHGLSIGALGATGAAAWRTPFEPLWPGFLHVAQPYVYRYDGTPDECGAHAADNLERRIVSEGPDTVAAFIAEPIAMPQAIKVPPDNYWQRVREICDRYGVLLIVDEVLTGFGRTGRLFASEHWDLQPDIMTIAKGLTSGYVPLSAAIASRRIADAFWGDETVAFKHGYTYQGHPVACAAALTNLDIFAREKLVDRAEAMGAHLFAGLEALLDYPLVGNVSGKGLFASVELVSDPSTKEPVAATVGRRIASSMAERGILARWLPNSIYIYPPLVIERTQIDQIVKALGDALLEASDRAPTAEPSAEILN